MLISPWPLIQHPVYNMINMFYLLFSGLYVIDAHVLSSFRFKSEMPLPFLSGRRRELVAILLEVARRSLGFRCRFRGILRRRNFE